MATSSPLSDCIFSILGASGEWEDAPSPSSSQNFPPPSLPSNSQFTSGWESAVSRTQPVSPQLPCSSNKLALYKKRKYVARTQTILLASAFAATAANSADLLGRKGGFCGREQWRAWYGGVIEWKTGWVKGRIRTKMVSSAHTRPPSFLFISSYSPSESTVEKKLN